MENKKENKNSILNKIPKGGKQVAYMRQKSMNNIPQKENNNKIISFKRKVKSREKEITKTKLFPLIKTNSLNSIQNSIPKEKNSKELNNILPNIGKGRHVNINNKVKKMHLNNLTNYDTNEKRKKKDLIDNENEKNKNFNLNDIIKYFEDLIDLSNSLLNTNLFKSLLNTFDKNYILHYTNNIINQTENTKFIECLKYASIIISCLLFLSKDEVSYKFNNQRLKELLDQFIFISLKSIDIFKITIPFKIKSFINKMNPTKKSYNNCINAIIKLLYNSKSEYLSLKNAFNQIISNINKLSLSEILSILNNSILYCLHYEKLKNKNILLKNNINNKANNKKNNNKKQDPNDELIPSAPYIKTKLTKKFCLVLDIDETITHTLKLPFGDYFFVRPGVKEFLREMVKYFEIVIFTSSPKSYADNILDKIDIYNEFFSHRLYRKHVVYENGNSVKRLDMIGRDLKKIVFVDNLKSNAKYNPKNLYHIKTWTNDINDNQLILLKNRLKDIITSGKYDDDITKGIDLI